MKGVVLGPIHKNQEDEVNETDLKQIDPILGSQEDFKDLLQSAKKKSRSCQETRKGLAFWLRSRTESLSGLLLTGSEFF